MKPGGSTALLLTLNGGLGGDRVKDRHNTFERELTREGVQALVIHSPSSVVALLCLNSIIFILSGRCTLNHYPSAYFSSEIPSAPQ